MNRTRRLLRDSARGLGRNRLRAALMMLGTFIGVAALIIIVAVGRGTQQEVLDSFDRVLSGSTILLRAGGNQVRGGQHVASGPTITLTIRDLDAVAAEVASVELVDPVLPARREVVHEGRSAEITIEGHAETAESVWNRSVTRGRFFSRDDVETSARVALVGDVVVDELFGGRDPVGEQIRIGTAPFRVIGVLEPGGMDPHGIDRDRIIMVPISTMMRRVANVDWVAWAKFGITQGADLDMAVLDIADVLRREHALGPDEPNDFAMFTPVQVQRSVREANRTFTLFLPLAAAVSILVGAIVVANLMFLTVTERRAEIGLRKAVGARDRDIRLQFMAEAAAITGLAGIGAAAAAYAVLMGLRVMDRAAPMPWLIAAIGVAVSVAVGILCGVAPARRAAALDPVIALR